VWLVHVPVLAHVVGVELEEQRGPKRCWIQIQFHHPIEFCFLGLDLELGLIQNQERLDLELPFQEPSCLGRPCQEHPCLKHPCLEPQNLEQPGLKGQERPKLLKLQGLEGVGHPNLR
jgi:hypothetical protein